MLAALLEERRVGENQAGLRNQMGLQLWVGHNPWGYIQTLMAASTSVITAVAAATSTSSVTYAEPSGSKTASSTAFVTLVKRHRIEASNELMHIFVHHMLLCHEVYQLLFLVHACVCGRIGRQLALVGQRCHLRGNESIDGLFVCVVGLQSTKCVLT